MPDVEMIHPLPTGLKIGTTRYDNLKEKLATAFNCVVYVGLGPNDISISFFVTRKPFSAVLNNWFTISKAICAADKHADDTQEALESLP